MIKIARHKVTAGQTELFALAGDFFRVLDADGVIRVSFDGAAAVDMMAGLAYGPPGGFRNLRITSETTQQIQFSVSQGIVHDNRLAGQVDLAGLVELTQTATKTATCNAVAVTAETVALTANADRRSALIQVTGGAAWYAPAAGAAANGIRIDDGGALRIENAQPVYLAPVAGAVTARILEEVN